MGEFGNAEQFLRATAASGSHVRGALAAYALVPMGAYALVRRGLALWYLGFPDQALALARKGSRLGDIADYPYLFAVVLYWAGLTHIYCGELAEAEELFRRSLNLCTERGFTAIRAGIVVFMGLVSVLRGQPQVGLEQMRRATEIIPEYYRNILALGLAAAGRPDEAFSALTRALEWTEQSGEKVALAQIHQTKGRLFEGKSNSKEAENSFRTSIEVARRQSAKSLELVATTSLARLLAKQDRRDEARAMLAEIYGWFTEGFGTADLKGAKALLDELST
jgi:tetratricopeptide (TPR) repeat protein